MRTLGWDRPAARALLAAMKAVAADDGALTLRGRALVEAERDHLLGCGGEIDGMVQVATQELACLVREPAARAMAVQ